MTDIEQIKREVADIVRFKDLNDGSAEVSVVNGFRITAAEKTIDYLHSRGYLGGVPEWQPIETAPMDGGVFLICLPRMMNLIIRARFDRVHQQWLSERVTGDSISNVEFFHPGDLWMPLPAAPKGETE